MAVELVFCLFELPPSDRSISRSVNFRYDICWNCIAAMNESYSCGNALITMANFRFSLIFSSADCSLNTMLSILFQNSIIDSPFFLSSRKTFGPVLNISVQTPHIYGFSKKNCK